MHSVSTPPNKPGHLAAVLSWLVLGVVLIIAIALWMLWLYGGMDFAHQTILSRVAPVASPAAATSVAPGSNARAPVVTPMITQRGTMFSELGQTGDSFGALNALLTAIAGALVFWAGFMQHQSLKQAREAAMSEQIYRKTQEFESLFFRLLELTSTAVQRIEAGRRNNEQQERHGTRALDSLAWRLFGYVGQHRGNHPDPKKLLEAIVKGYLIEVYARQPSAFGPYLRLLYQTFKHISESGLSEEQQIRYANIARGQISDGAILLLAANGLTHIGAKFVPLIEKFGLLEHMHRRYLDQFEVALLIGYRRRAFLGSRERSMPGNEWHEQPLLNQDFFSNLNEEADMQAAFNDVFEDEEIDK